MGFVRHTMFQALQSIVSLRLLRSIPVKAKATLQGNDDRRIPIDGLRGRRGTTAGESESSGKCGESGLAESAGHSATGTQRCAALGPKLKLQQLLFGGDPAPGEAPQCLEEFFSVPGADVWRNRRGRIDVRLDVPLRVHGAFDERLLQDVR